MSAKGMLVEVEPRLKEYEPYAFWLLGASMAGYRATGVNQDTISLWLKGKYNQTTHLGLKFEYHITEHPLRRQLGGDGGAGRSNNKVS